MPDGRMFPHSLRQTIPKAQRVRYQSEHGGGADAWKCPGSYEYFGPRDVSTNNSDVEDDSDDMEQSE